MVAFPEEVGPVCELTTDTRSTFNGTQNSHNKLWKTLSFVRLLRFISAYNSAVLTSNHTKNHTAYYFCHVQKIVSSNSHNNTSVTMFGDARECLH